MDRAVLALALIAVAAVVAVLLERRRTSAPTQPRRWEVPAQLDRADFGHPERPWLVAVFTSSTCESCERVIPKAEALASPEVGVVEVPYQSRKDLHERYAVEIVPTLVVAGADGAVRASFIGVPTATDLWAAVAEARQPGSSPEPHLGTLHPDPGP